MARFSIRRRWLAATVLVAALALVPAFVSAQGTTTALNARLTGAGEVPATTSAAVGTFTATLDEAANTLTWSLSVPTITNTTAAHLHVGAAGTNGALVLPLFAAPTGSPASSINVSGTSKSADLTGPLQGQFAEFAKAIKAGTIYANVHTSANPGGEIRDQVAVGAAAAQATTAPGAPKTGNAGLASSGTSMVAVALLAVLTLGVVVGGRVLAARRA